MTTRKKLAIGVLIVFFLLLTACSDSGTGETEAKDKSPDAEDASDESSVEKQTDKEPDQSEDMSNAEEPPVDSSEKESISAESENLKEEYLRKLKQTRKEMQKLRENPEDPSTYAMKKVEGERSETWDNLLNEIYQVLEKQLPTAEMEKLRQKQREWIDYRDATALEASKEYEGGTMEQLEYVAVKANLTADRCFELVREYMK